MEQHQDYTFNAESLLDLPTYHEVDRSYGNHNPPVIIYRLFACGYLLYLMSNFQYDTYCYLFLVIAALLAITRLVQWRQNRNGNIDYKRMLASNNGKPPHNILSFAEDGIHQLNTDTGNSRVMAYGDVQSLFETKNQLILILKYRMILPITKSTLTGGTKEAFITFLKSHCPKLKKKRLHQGMIGKITEILFMVLLTVGLVLAIGQLSGLNGRITSNMRYQEIALELEELGITGSTPELLDELEALHEEYTAAGYTYDKTTDLLCWLGMGEYDEETWEWTPSTNGVYWFDAEVLNLESIYTDFLRGVSALDSSELDFANIQEDITQVDFEHGTGIQSASFDWQGQRYTLEANVMNDWFDISAAKQLNSIICSHSSGEQLYFAFDGGQGYLVFYADTKWVKAFEFKTGIKLYSDIDFYTNS